MNRFTGNCLDTIPVPTHASRQPGNLHPLYQLQAVEGQAQALNGYCLPSWGNKFSQSTETYLTYSKCWHISFSQERVFFAAYCSIEMDLPTDSLDMKELISPKDGYILRKRGKLVPSCIKLNLHGKTVLSLKYCLMIIEFDFIIKKITALQMGNP